MNSAVIGIGIVVLVAAIIVGMVCSGWKSAAGWIVVGIFLAATPFGQTVRSTLVDLTDKGGDTVSTVTDVGGK